MVCLPFVSTCSQHCKGLWWWGPKLGVFRAKRCPNAAQIWPLAPRSHAHQGTGRACVSVFAASRQRGILVIGNTPGVFSVSPPDVPSQRNHPTSGFAKWPCFYFSSLLHWHFSSSFYVRVYSASPPRYRKPISPYHRFLRALLLTPNIPCMQLEFC